MTVSQILGALVMVVGILGLKAGYDALRLWWESGRRDHEAILAFRAGLIAPRNKNGAYESGLKVMGIQCNHSFSAKAHNY